MLFAGGGSIPALGCFMRAMEITFTKTGPRTYEVVVLRDDGVTLRVRTPDKPLKIPHDMAHYVVERELNMERGFWGSIAAGVLFGTVQVVSGRQPPHAAEQSAALIKVSYRAQAAAELYVAVLQRVAVESKEQDFHYVSSCLDEVWRPFRWPRPHVSAEDALRVCRALREAESLWAALPVGESIKVTWASAQRKGAARRGRA
jgi:hypothetical protein